ncbi:OLC1v1019464C1 [Oldenlandia corymbosa var. corymbosa]|uniref:OLC1v1019464C1 n=1 Tax=Oldenlandia corymbosa var. corymbosa TaxID=529605 RepID=A0AAV1EE84_OLDCO|nr:OLC1v1019464C1 [Oldenlandia corymbosa var. corymbosa]
MASLQLPRYYLHDPISYSPKLLHFRNPNSVSYSRKLLWSKKISGFLDLRHSRSIPVNGSFPLCRVSKESAELEPIVTEEERRNEHERPPFDINLAVILAGFAFEAYTTPPEDVGKREVDAAGCQTVFLSESFVREIYDGQLFIKLKKGLNLPAMDLWGTSDPYVVFQLDSQVLKSKTKWGTKEPTWNEEFVFNIKLSPDKILQVAAWDANLVTPHKRMGNSGVELESVCDGSLHDVVVDLEGMGGGGKIELEIRYKSFEKLDQEKQWWRIPIVTEFLEKYGFDNLIKTALGSETVQARQFVEFAFGQIKTLNDEYLHTNWLPTAGEGKKYSNDPTAELGTTLETESMPESSSTDGMEKVRDSRAEEDIESSAMDNREGQAGEPSESDEQFWKILGDTVNQNVVQRFGLPAPSKIKWDGFDILNNIGLQSRKNAETVYIESGLATPEDQDSDSGDSPNQNQSSLANIKKVTQELLQQTDAVLGALMVLNATVSKISKGAGLLGKDGEESSASKETRNDISESTSAAIPSDNLILDEKKAEEMRALFSSAESAMEAWAMLATALGHPSFIKSEFEKICFLDNSTTDTQVALWRDPSRKRLVVAFRGTEQARWKDLRTDLMLVPAGLNPERIGGDFKEEVQVHSGFLSAYDSVRTRIIRLIKQVVGYNDDDPQPLSKWHVYVTGHSLGGALATLLALELASSQLAKMGAISVTMYNFGSPRVGNKKFAELYNEKVHDSWRVVNHRDIIPTVPRLMGYCHVAQPVYLAPGDLENALENMSLMADGYEGDVLGESTPDVIVSEFMKGEKQLIEKILNTEINIFLSIRDGSALMQHMEDFYYVTLLESVRSNYQTVARSQPNEEKSLPIG